MVEQVRRGAMSRHNQSMYAPPHPGQVLEQCFNQSFTVERAAAQMGVAPQVLHDVMAELRRDMRFGYDMKCLIRIGKSKARRLLLG